MLTLAYFNYEPLYSQGAHSALFKLTLTFYGYIIVTKGIILTLISYLRHKAVIYKRLSSL
jgi:hypothetical protein